MKLTSVIVALLVTAGSAAAQEKKATPAGMPDRPHAIVATPDAITWAAAPAILPAGAKLAVLEGDPTKAEAFTMRLSMPAGYRIPPHFHPVTEHVTVIDGTFYVGMGETFDSSNANALPAGTFAALAPGVRHFAFTRGATTIQLHGVGPWSLTYVNPADDPRGKAR
jgi:quercetin dioxygenase-like cupin family protein